MELRIRYGILIAICLICSAQATGDRAAMVVETKGNNTLTVHGEPLRMRTLQVLPAGAKVTVPEGAVLRLSYFKSGNKEKVLGPCTLDIQQESSKLLKGSGKIELQARRNATTDLDKSNNLRRMGGALQANTGQTPDSELRKLNEIAMADGSVAGRTPAPLARPSVAPQTSKAASAPASEPTSTGIRVRGSSPEAASSTENASGGNESKPAKKGGKSPYFIGRNLSYLEPAQAALVEWTPAKEGTLTLYRHEKKVFSSAVSTNKFQLPIEHLQAGSGYRLVLSQDKLQSTQEFRILNKAQTDEYKALVAQIRKQESQDRPGLLSQLIFLYQDLGLFQEAERAARAAVKEFPKNSGFWMALGQIQAKLNKKEAAKASFERAREVESGP